MSQAETTSKVTCRVCRRTYIPSFSFDFYPDGDDSAIGRCEDCLFTEELGNLNKKPDPQPIPSQNHLMNVCRRGEGSNICRYLCVSQFYSCAKGSSAQSFIDKRFIEGTMKAKGDNCSGPPSFEVK